MKIQLSDHFTYGRLARFVLPSIGMMICTSIYSVVDGFFVSNYVGKIPFAAVNLIMPVIMVLSSIGFMLGAGGSAIVAKTLGEGDHDRAEKYFTLITMTGIVSGAILAILGIIFMPMIASALGARGEMLDLCVLYARVVLIALPASAMQNIFQSFLITAQRPHLGLFVTIGAGVTNIVLDAVLVGWLKMGVQGAAAATAFSQVVGGLVPLIYFMTKNKSLLHFRKTKLEVSILVKTCINGSSELLTNISTSVVSMLYNIKLLEIAGENGVAAYGAIMYVQFIFMAIFFGYSMGTAPIIGYNYGAGNHSEQKNIFKKSLWAINICGLVMAAASFVLAAPLAKVYVGYDEVLYNITVRGFQLYAITFLMCGVNIFGSAFFTALNNGAVSAAISFLRTVVFQVAAVLILPIFLGIDGIWLSISFAELLSMVITISMFVLFRKTYHYA